MGSVISSCWDFFVPIEDSDNFTVIVRKIICAVIGMSALFGGACPYYAYRAFKAPSSNETLSIAGGASVPESKYVVSFIILSATLAIYTVLALFVAIYCRMTKTAPDWLMYLCLLQICAVTISFDVITRFPFPVRSTSIGLSIIAIGAGLEHSKLIVVALLFYTICNEVRDAWGVQMRIDSPYEGGPVEKLGFALTGIFSLVACSVLMGGMLFEYTTLLGAAKTSVDLAKTVASLLLVYDTDSVRDELDDFAKQFGITMTTAEEEEVEAEAKKKKIAAEQAGEQSKEPTQEPHLVAIDNADAADGDALRHRRANESAKDLVEVFREMAANLDMYRPHLPDYVLPKGAVEDECEEEEEEDEDESDGYDEQGNLLPHKKKKKTPLNFSFGRRSSVHSRTTNEDDEDIEMRGGIFDNDSQASDAISVNTDDSGSPSPPQHQHHLAISKSASTSLAASSGVFIPSGSASHYQQQQQQPHDMQSMGRQTDVGTSFGGGAGNKSNKTALRKKLTVNFAALSHRTGAHNENVIVARIDLGRFMDCLLEHALGAGNTDHARNAVAAALVSKKANTIIERVLDAAASLDATVHAFIDDSISASWNATRRSVQTEMKCCKFLVRVREIAGEMLIEAGALPVASSSSAGGSGGQPGIYDMRSPPSARAGGGGSSSSERLASSGGGGGGAREMLDVSITSIGSESLSGSTGSTPSKGSRSNSPARSPSQQQPLSAPTAAATMEKEREREREEALNQLQRLVTGAAMSGSAWCQIGGSEKKQQFMLSRFSHTHALARACEMSASSGFLVICPRIFSKVRWELAVQGCGAVNVPVRQTAPKTLPGAQRRRSSLASPPSGGRRGSISPSMGRRGSVTPPAALRSISPHMGPVPAIETTSPNQPPLHRGDTSIPIRRDNSLEDSSSSSPPPPDRRASTSTAIPATIAGIPLVHDGSFSGENSPKSSSEQSSSSVVGPKPLTVDALREQDHQQAGLKVSFGYDAAAELSANNNNSSPSFGSGGGSFGVLSGSFGQQPVAGNHSFVSNHSFTGAAAAAAASLSSLLFRRETIALYELVGPKKKAGAGKSETEDNEWMYALDGTDITSGGLSDAVGFIARGDFARARGCLDGLKKDVPDVERLTHGAFSMVERSLAECVAQHHEVRLPMTSSG